MEASPTLNAAYGHVVDDAPPARECPPDGLHDAVLVDWRDEPNAWHNGRQSSCIQLYWQIAPRDAHARRFIVQKRFHKTLSGNSVLRRWLETWQQKPFSYAERRIGVWLEMWVGLPCQVEVRSFPLADGRMWTNVDALMAWNFAHPRRPLEAEQYRRFKSPKPHWRR